ncbi:MAG TPA: sigma-70 family RNA polymerase sigma factor [Puia sp.]|nr:sigma-70 family RNA polymerase sigma factor [Puia sp.]
MDNKTEIFLEYKNLLFSIAYNMLSSIHQAEDIVQDTYLKWMAIETDKVQHTKAFLVKMVTHRCINHLGSARVQREDYIGIWLPEPLQDTEQPIGQFRVESHQALSIGMLVLMEKLTPQERAIFLLKEIFSYDYFELAEIFDKSSDSCRQIFKRAKDHLGKDTRRFEVDLRVHEKMLRNFLLAIEEGSMEDLIQLLKEDIYLFTDGGGKTFFIEGQRFSAFKKPILGRDKISRLLLGFIPRFRQAVPDFSEDIVFTNGMPSIVCWSGTEPVSLVSLEPDGEHIRNIYVQTNPEKLRHLKKSL